VLQLSPFSIYHFFFAIFFSGKTKDKEFFFSSI
jgi:hypothetical protein